MNLPIRILFVIDSLIYGGAQRQLVELIKGLVNKKNYEIHVVCLLWQKISYADIIESIGIHVNYFHRSCKIDLVNPLSALYFYIQKHRIDLIHGFMNMGCLFGALAAKLTCRPIICSAIRDAKDNSTKVKYLKRFLANIADIYVSNTQAGFTNRFSLLKPHFRVVYNGVDFFRFDKQYDISSSLRNELCVSNFLHVVGMVGALSSNKDQDTLLSAATHILKKFPDTGFLFVGDGERREFLEKKAKILGIDKYVRFSGFRSDVDRLYNLMDVCVLLTNSQNHLEGIPNVLIEAMACNIPVVATVGGGTNEIVTHEKTGILVPPQDPLRTAKAIIDLLTDSDKAISMSLVACSWVHEMFNLERYTSDYENIYRELNFNNRSKLSN